MIVKGGFSTYGQPIGIIMFKGSIPRIPGDIGHAETLGFNVCYEVLDDVCFMDLVEGSDKTRDSLIMAAKRLELKGVKAIAGDCGLLARYQEDIASKLKVPFFSSSLMLIPLAWQIQGRKGKVGVVTGHSKLLNKDHLVNAGVTENIPLIIEGMENEEEFTKVVINGEMELDTEKMKNCVLNVCSKFMSGGQDVCSIVLECSNLPSFAYDINKQFNVPVYDIVGLAKMMHNAVCPSNYGLL